MPASVNSRALLAGLMVLTAAGASACSAIGGSSGAGPASGQTTMPATNATASPPATAAAPAALTTSPPASSSGVENLHISSPEKNELTAAYTAFIGVPLSDLKGAAPLPSDTYYAYDPTTDTYWAKASFGASTTAPSSVVATFQDRGMTGLFTRVGARPWQVKTTGAATYCGVLQFFPVAVLRAWMLPTAPPAGENC